LPTGALAELIDLLLEHQSLNWREARCLLTLLVKNSSPGVSANGQWRIERKN
tara:strand:- start:419 stop:574 length:156 start_codon:yes stop_codon:yes gene_type:complete